MIDKIFGISTYGICLAIAFLFAMRLLPKELERKGMNPVAADWIILVGMIGGIVGSKIAYIIEFRAEIFMAGFWPNLAHWSGVDELGNEFRFWRSLFSGGGLTFYGGLILAAIMIYYVLRHYKISVIRGFDAIAPAMAMGYVWGRLGCFFSGDGCYGNAVKGDTWFFKPLIWDYPTQSAFPTGGLVYNTPVMESLISLGLFFLLSWLRKKPVRDGLLLSVFFFFHGMARFVVEFFRHNTADISFVGVIPGLEMPSKLGAQLGADPAVNWEILNTHYWYGLTQAQLISLVLMAFAVAWILKNKLWQNPDRN